MIGDLTINFGANVGGFTAPIVQVKTGLENVSSTATLTKFNLDAMASSLSALSTAGAGLSLLSSKFTFLNSSIGLLSAGLKTVLSGVSMVGAAAFTTASSIGILLAPLKGLTIVATAAGASLLGLAKIAIAPFRIAIGVMAAFTRGIMAALKPLLSVAKTLFLLKVSMASFGFQLRLISKFLTALPPPLRALVVGLTAVGVAGRAGGFAMGILSKGLSAVAFAATAVTNPVRAVGIASLFATKSLLGLSLAAVKASAGMGKLAVTGAITTFKALGAAVMSVTAKLTGAFLTALTTVASVLGTLAVVGVGWGVKLAADAERAETGFATLLKSASAAKWVMQELDNFAAGTPFRLPALQDASIQLLSVQVATGNLTKTLGKLGDIASGTNKPLGDFVRLYAKVKATGRMNLDTLNSFAERGVPIYEALSQSMNVSRTEMLKMISDGKVGFAQLDAAINDLTTGSGMFANSTANQASKIAGVWSTLMDNIAGIARVFGENLAKAFDFTGRMNRGIAILQTIKANIGSIAPLFAAVANTVSAYTGMLFDVASKAFGGIRSVSGITFNGIMETAMKVYGTLTYAFNSWEDVAQLAFAKVKYFAVAGFSTIGHFFTDVIPGWLSWFGENWSDVFKTAGLFVGNVFMNMARNIRDIMGSIWDFIASGGTKSLSMAWKPLTDGFVSTVKELPDIPKRAISDLERQLKVDADRIGEKVAIGLADQIDKNLAMLKNVGTVEIQPFENIVTDKIEPNVQENQFNPDTTANQPQRVTPEALMKGSVEAFEKIANFRNRSQNDPQKQLVSLQREQNRTARESAAALGDIRESLKGHGNGQSEWMNGWGMT